AFLDLSGLSEIQGTWKAPVTVPCTYVPQQDLEQQTLTWRVDHDKSSATIFRRDQSGDHVLLSAFRDRVSVLQDTPGNVSLQILTLEMSDRGTYTCRVTWRTSNSSLVAREVSTKLEVVRVAASKPRVLPGAPGLALPPGSRASLACVASGSPPIRYRWFRGAPGRAALLLGSRAELRWDSLQPSDAGTYFCEAQGR
ncbi:VSIG4 protein, partial [Centropus bengalensis]|nr:VSIG4 protein [Centropus bengalensis]